MLKLKAGSSHWSNIRSWYIQTLDDWFKRRVYRVKFSHSGVPSVLALRTLPGRSSWRELFSLYSGVGFSLTAGHLYVSSLQGGFTYRA